MPITTPELKFTPLDFKAVAADGAFEGYATRGAGMTLPRMTPRSE
jgi:hypothetical protein